MKNLGNCLFRAFAAAGLLAVAMTAYLAFASAFANPEKFATIFINLYGEANLEAVILPVVMALGGLLFVSALRDVFRAVLCSVIFKKLQIDVLEV